jgi:hypothetical protein
MSLLYCYYNYCTVFRSICLFLNDFFKIFWAIKFVRRFFYSNLDEDIFKIFGFSLFIIIFVYDGFMF